MNNTFAISDISDKKFLRVVLSLSYKSLDQYLHELEDCLKRSKIKGLVLLDLLLSNGMKSDRFASMYFDGQKFDLESYKIEKSVDKYIVYHCTRCYQNNSHLLEGSVLTKPQRFLIKRGEYCMVLMQSQEEEINISKAILASNSFSEYGVYQETESKFWQLRLS